MSVVLIVEDEQHIADGLKFNLEAEGYDVETAPDGETALELLAKNPKRSQTIQAIRRRRARRDVAGQGWF